MKIIFESGIEVECQLYLDKCPRTIKALLSSLPIKSTVNLWGDEIYFHVPFSVGEENSKDVVEVGDVAYWPEGPSLCIFFGPTPISPSSDVIKPYSPVNVIGKILGDVRILKRVKDGEEVKIVE
ncbi:MAG: cyclophilin-like fold protein [Candidatus Methanomethyliaceae archaeon]|nr:cyclophilin-like fold protein [Candidatus Methanomethyliaceae archaeon]MDW7970538.1 cyclophilin-like fold protein [Nitrososphaerota archaeon]